MKVTDLMCRRAASLIQAIVLFTGLVIFTLFFRPLAWKVISNYAINLWLNALAVLIGLQLSVVYLKAQQWWVCLGRRGGDGNG